MITVNNLTFTYGKDQPPVLKSLNLDINEGEYLALIGPNGCGKTTLIKHFNALFFPTAGEVRIDGLCTRDPHHLLEIRRRVGMIFQNPDNQIVGMSVEEDVAFGPGNLGLPSAEVRRRVDCALETVGLNGLETRPPHTLSGGQKQLLALAGLLAMNPGYILLDEPTSSLDPAGKENVLSLLQRLQGQGIGVIHVTHSMDEAAVADRVLVLDRGELIADGSPGKILSQVDWLRSLGLAPPRMAELMWRLRQMGLEVNPRTFTTDEAAGEITALLKRLEVSSPNCLSWKVGENV
jgi:energy-coupling factor transporter ATPase